MDFHAAMETFAEAWVAANTHTAVNSDPSSSEPTQTPTKSLPSNEPPTTLPKEKTTSQKSLMSEKGGGKESPSSSKNEGTKSLPVHCVIEQVSGVPSFDGSGCNNTTQELDSYAILPSTTTLNDLVRVALTKLGYSPSDSLNARGAIHFKNWKPLTFDKITDNLQATVEDILGDLINVATLKIRICSDRKLSSADDVKEKLLQLLLNQSQGMLLNTGCPIDKVMLASISQGHLPDNLTADTRKDFDRWFSEQFQKSTKQLEGSSSAAAGKSRSESPDPNGEKCSPSKSLTTTTTSAMAASSSSASTPVCPSLSAAAQLASASIASSTKHTRMRTSFDPEHEIPRLQKWFQVNQHPTREQMIIFLSELNSLDSRKGRKQLDLTNIIYWFKNARAAFRRANKSSDDSQIDGDDSLCLYQEAEESTKDEGCIETEERSNSPMEEAIPYLPNRNAVYVIPNPLHRIIPEEQATDLTTNKHKDHSANSPKTLCQSDSEAEEGKPEKSNEKSLVLKVEPESANEVKDTSSLNNFSRKRHHSEEECGSEDEENEPSAVKAQKNVVKQEAEDEIDYMSIHSHNQMARVLAQSPHNRLALSIPHMPHPLAMHYIPLNAQYYHAHLQQQQRSHLAQQQLNVSHSNSSPSTQNNNGGGSVSSAKAALDKKRRTRVFIDPLSEIPKLEQWFLEDTHPSAYMIDKYCEELNRSEYRRKYPRLEPKNVQLWFKNHRAKVKRMRIEGPGGAMNYKYDESSPGGDLYDYDQNSSQSYDPIDQGRAIMSA